VTRTIDESRGVARFARRPGAVLAVAAATALILTGCTTAGGATSTHKTGDNSDAYGSLPSFLPPQTLKADSVLTGTIARPALTTEGDAVKVVQGSTSTLATVTGPEVPGEGLPVQTEATTCTWTVTISAGSAPATIAASQFTSIDHLGALYRPTFVDGQPTPPSVLAPHATTTFELRAVMQTGEGLMRWAPDGHDIVAEWDFEVEND
jgi:hypothetical protein